MKFRILHASSARVDTVATRTRLETLTGALTASCGAPAVYARRSHIFHPAPQCDANAVHASHHGKLPRPLDAHQKRRKGCSACACIQREARSSPAASARTLRIKRRARGAMRSKSTDFLDLLEFAALCPDSSGGALRARRHKFELQIQL